jgi:hypothetical protein
MASLVTNRGAYLLLGFAFRGTALPTNYYVALATNGTPPTVDSNLISDCTQIATGNGYSAGGVSLTPGATDFDTYTEDDANDRALVRIKDITFTASGGNLPASGSGARWTLLTDDNATVNSRQVLAAHDLSSDRTVSDGQDLTIQDIEIRASTV